MQGVLIDSKLICNNLVLTVTQDQCRRVLPNQKCMQPFPAAKVQPDWDHVRCPLVIKDNGRAVEV